MKGHRGRADGIDPTTASWRRDGEPMLTFVQPYLNAATLTFYICVLSFRHTHSKTPRDALLIRRRRGARSAACLPLINIDPVDGRRLEGDLWARDR